MFSATLQGWAVSHPNGRYLCPLCSGGSGHEKSLTVWEEGWYKLAKCHRASCDAFSKSPIAFGTGDAEIAAPAPSTEVLRPYRADTYPICMYPNVLEAFKRKYGFDGQGILTCSWGDAPLIIPIFCPRGNIRGHVEKRGLFPGEQKLNRIWKAKEEPMLSWTRHNGYEFDSVILVEDQISALKYAAFTGMRAVALLGTNLTIQAVAEIQRNAKHVTIALDADATAKAFRIARRWGAAFSSCQVKILDKDIKNDPQYNTPIPEVLPGSIRLVDTRGNWTSSDFYFTGGTTLRSGHEIP